MREDVLNKLYNTKEKVVAFINEAESILNKVVLLSIVLVTLIWINLDRIIEIVVSENRIKSDLIAKLEKVTGKKTDVLGGISFKSEPEPIVVVNKVKIANDSDLTNESYFFAETIQSKPSILKAIIGRVNFDNIFFENAEFNLAKTPGSKNQFYDTINKLFTEESQIAGKKLIFKNLKINVHKQNPLGNRHIKRTIEFLDLELDPSPAGKKNVSYTIKGSINSRRLGEVYFFEIDLSNDLGKKAEYTGKIYSTDAQIKLSGALDSTSKLSFNGKLDGSIKGVTKKLIALLGASEQFTDNIRDTDNSVISCNYSFDGQNFIIDKLETKGDTIDFNLSSKTELKDKISSIIDIDISKLEYSRIFKSYVELISEKKAKRIERDFRKRIEDYLIFAIGDDINFLFQLKAPSINFFQGQKGSAEIVALLKDNNFKLKNLSAKLPGNSSLNFTAELEINKEKNQLKGTSRLLVSGEDMDLLYKSLDSTAAARKERRFANFLFDAKAFLYGQNIHIREIASRINEDTFSGQMLVDYSDELKASSAFNFTSLNLDKYLLSESLEEEGVSRPANSLASKFDFLRLVDSIFDRIDITLLADNMVKSGNRYSDVSVYTQITPGITEFKDIFFNSETMGQVKGTAKLDLTDFQPKLDINLEIQNYDSDLLFYGETIQQNNSYNFNGKWSTEKVTFEKLGNFLGKMAIKIKNFRIYHYDLANFSMKAHSEEGKFTIDQARADIFGNKVDFKGFLTTDYPSFSLSFVASELNSEKFMADTLGLDQVYSIFNMSGVLASTGYSVEQMIQNLKGNLSIATKGFKVSGFDLVTVSKALPLAKRREYVALIANELLSKGETEFNFFIGSFNIDSGLISFSDLSLTSMNTQKAKVSGVIDLPNWKLDIYSDMDVVASDKKPFNIKSHTTGAIPNISTKWDTTGMLTYWENKFFGGR